MQWTCAESVIPQSAVLPLFLVLSGRSAAYCSVKNAKQSRHGCKDVVARFRRKHKGAVSAAQNLAYTGSAGCRYTAYWKPHLHHEYERYENHKKIILARTLKVIGPSVEKTFRHPNTWLAVATANRLPAWSSPENRLPRKSAPTYLSGS